MATEELSKLEILPESTYQLAKQIFILIKSDYLRIYTNYQVSDKFNRNQMSMIYDQLTHFYMQYQLRLPEYLAHDVYQQAKQFERLVELLYVCDEALASLDRVLWLLSKDSEDQEIISNALSAMRKQYQNLVDHVGVDGSVINRINSVIDEIHGQYRLLRIENKALFFAQLENIHDQTVRYIRHYIELEFVGRYIDRGFDEFNTLLRLTLDNSIYRKQGAK